jgi:cell division protein FtsB
LALALALGSIGYTLLGPKGSGKQVQLQEELERLHRDNQNLAEENRRLAEEVEALKHRAEYIEKVAREELGVVHHDDLVFHLPPGKSDDGGASADPKGTNYRP